MIEGLSHCFAQFPGVFGGACESDANVWNLVMLAAGRFHPFSLETGLLSVNYRGMKCGKKNYIKSVCYSVNLFNLFFI
jgi:hypothetical protein